MRPQQVGAGAGEGGHGQGDGGRIGGVAQEQAVAVDPALGQAGGNHQRQAAQDQAQSQVGQLHALAVVDRRRDAQRNAGARVVRDPEIDVARTAGGHFEPEHREAARLRPRGDGQLVARALGVPGAGRVLLVQRHRVERRQRQFGQPVHVRRPRPRQAQVQPQRARGAELVDAVRLQRLEGGLAGQHLLQRRGAARVGPLQAGGGIAQRTAAVFQHDGGRRRPRRRRGPGRADAAEQDQQQHPGPRRQSGFARRQRP